ncbi:MAG TPA: hypothetical protein VK631_26720, partial [Solirubrobacteraceae bacterium]|nr:hypothetical protein [Solirubrobacteraceae bacterium]
MRNDLKVGGAAIAGANALDFTITDNGCAGARVEHGETCSIGVRLTPSATGARTASLALTTNRATGAESLTLDGTGVAQDSGPVGRPGPQGSGGPR